MMLAKPADLRLYVEASDNCQAMAIRRAPHFEGVISVQLVQDIRRHQQGFVHCV